MRVWLHRGTIYLSGYPDDQDSAFADRLWKEVGVASYHGGHHRWVISLSREAVAGLKRMGIKLTSEFDDWEAEQDNLAVRRRQANKVKGFSDRELRALLVKAGVWFDKRLKTHQLLGACFAIKLPACALLMDTGTGKTATMATVMQAMVDKRNFRRMLVVAPKSILDVGWGDDLDQWSRDLKWVNISDPPRREEMRTCPKCDRTFKKHVAWRHLRTHMKKAIDAKGEEKAKEILYERYPQLISPVQDDKRTRLLRALAGDEQVFLINPEGFKIVLDDLSEEDWDMVTVDESSMLKSPKSKITQKMQLFGGRVNRRVIMTATPRPNSSMDFWGQMAFLDQCLGGNFYAFRNKYFYEDHSGYVWHPKSSDVDHEIWDVVSQRSYRVKLEDCVDLPGETTERVGIKLTGKLAEHYDDMLKNMCVQIDNGKDEEGKIIDTQWKLVQMNKLAQITSGYIFDNDGNSTFLADSPKIQATIDMAKRLIEDEDRFVVIWVRFTKTEGKAIEEALSKYGVSTLHGQTKNVKASVEAFKSKKNRVMIAHAASAKFGHTWTHSNVAIFHSYDYSWENFYQAKRRIYRLGQDKPVTYITNVAIDTVDEEILSKVFSKEEASDAVVDDNVFANLARRRRLSKR
jgi:SNF2 family DNA or RNA helicase